MDRGGAGQPRVPAKGVPLRAEGDQEMGEDCKGTWEQNSQAGMTHHSSFTPGIPV